MNVNELIRKLSTLDGTKQIDFVANTSNNPDDGTKDKHLNGVELWNDAEGSITFFLYNLPL